MPQFGLKTVTPAAAPADAGQAPPLPWKLPNAEVVQVAFEVDVDATLELLPEQLSRPVPPYARVVVARYPESPVGPYTEALLLLSCRFRMEPKQYVVDAVVSSEAARSAYAALLGLPARTGDVRLTRELDDASGTETISAEIAAGGPLASVRMPGAYAVEPAMVRYDPFLTVRGGADGAEVVQFSGAPAVHSARLAKGATITCRSDAWSDPWFRLRSLNMISATFAVADLELSEPNVLPPPAR
jgi:acetoacetate decarboxylase